MTQDELLELIESIARHCRSIGMSVEINYSLPYVAVDLIDVEYFFQGEEAYDLLNEVPEWVNEEDYILWVSQGW